MSRLTYALQRARPTRKLCLQAMTRIEDLEDALIELQKHELGVTFIRGADREKLIADALRQPELP